MRTLITLFTVAGGLLAAPIQWGGNGHYYELITTSATFDQARTNALGMSFLGQQGYLVTVTSAQEQAFLAANFATGSSWGGGSDAAVEGEWRWLDGPEANQLFANGGTAVTYANWQGGEPNNVGNEDGLILFQFGPAGGWNDGPLGSQLAYIVEYDAPASTGVPEPSTFVLLSLGTAVCAGMRRRVRR